MRTGTVLCLLLLSGCATTWRHPDNVPVTQFNRDNYECSRDAAYIPRNVQPDPTLGWADVAAQNIMFNRCMQARGYTR